MMHNVILLFVLTLVDAAEDAYATDNLVNQLVDGLSDRVFQVQPGSRITHLANAPRSLGSAPRSALSVRPSSYPVLNQFLSPRFSPVLRAESGVSAEEEAEVAAAKKATADFFASQKAASAERKAKAAFGDGVEQGSDGSLYAQDDAAVSRGQAITQVVSGLAWTIVGVPLITIGVLNTSGSKEGLFAEIKKRVYKNVQQESQDNPTSKLRYADGAVPEIPGR